MWRGFNKSNRAGRKLLILGSTAACFRYQIAPVSLNVTIVPLTASAYERGILLIWAIVH